MHNYTMTPSFTVFIMLHACLNLCSVKIYILLSDFLFINFLYKVEVYSRFRF